MDVDSLLSMMAAEQYGEESSASSGSDNSDDDSSNSSDDDDTTYTFPGDATIWNDAVAPPPSRWFSKPTAPLNRTTQASDEVWRFKSMTFLRNKFDKTCKQGEVARHRGNCDFFLLHS